MGHDLKATISKIAAVSGYAPATVDRVLNERGGVRERTRDIVLQTARRLGYFGPQATPAETPVRIAFVLPDGDNTFMAMLRTFIIEQAEQHAHVEPILHLYQGFEPQRLAERLLKLGDDIDALAIIAPDHPAICEAINRLAGKGIHVATLVSDLPRVNKAGYIGIDNRAAGRLAGLLTGRFLRADQGHTVAVFIGSSAYRGHEEREMGFRSILEQDFPNLHISHFIRIRDDREMAFEKTRALLASNPPAAMYNIGAGTQGISRALTDTLTDHRPVFIAHDLTEATKMMLLNRTVDAVIDQNPRVEAREVIQLLVATVRGSSQPAYPPRLQVVLRENIPAL